MKRIFLLLALPLLGAVTACNRVTDTFRSGTAGGVQPAPLPVAPVLLAAPYEVRGVVDPDLHNLVAFALKVPQGWQLRQSLTREWSGTTPLTQVYLHLLAPDGEQQIELLPERPYYFVDGPQARNLRYVAATDGAAPPPSPYELAPMSAMAYLKRVLLPRLSQRGLHLAVSGEHEQALPPQGAATRRSSAYVDGRLPNGRLARVECLVSISPTNLNGEVHYNWTALPTITQSPADLAATFAHVAVVRTSLVCNPTWVRQNQQLVSSGQRPDQLATSPCPAGQQDFQSYQQPAYQTVANRPAVPATNQGAEVTAAGGHVYHDEPGTTLRTNAPLEASYVDWLALQLVELGTAY